MTSSTEFRILRQAAAEAVTGLAYTLVAEAAWGDDPPGLVRAQQEFDTACAVLRLVEPETADETIEWAGRQADRRVNGD